MGEVNALLDEIASAVQKLYLEAVDPLEGSFAFEKRPGRGEIGGAPMVLFLGNHSSGKSTFINHLLGQPVQKTGLAPTDDAFTVLSWGPGEEERDGQSVATNPELPFAGLRPFGPQFLSHFRLKLRPIPLLREVTLVDSPGMIDAPQEGSGRGYHYPGVVRWFADHADLVLVFFDPEKPGTTGETLDVFLRSLQGIDHKLVIVMNKMDQFRSLHDFARAYGALCWNLGKVIPRKDLPHIYTTFIPVPDAPRPALPVEDFERAREELVAEVKRSPARRVDNLLSHLQGHAERLRVHVRVADRAARDLGRFRFRGWSLLVLVSLIGVLAGSVLLTAGVDAWIPALFFCGSVLAFYAGTFVVRALSRGEERRIAAELGSVFEKVHARELLQRERVDDLRALWEGVHPRTRATLEALGLSAVPRLDGESAGRLDRLLETEIPQLRARLHRELSAASRNC
jgi:hypothetical protein